MDLYLYLDFASKTVRLYLAECVMDSPVELADRQTTKTKVWTHATRGPHQIRFVLVWHHIASCERLKQVQISTQFHEFCYNFFWT